VLAGCTSPAAPPVFPPEPLTYTNPFIDCPGAADPAVLLYEGRYYLYPTLDCTGYDVFVSDNLVDWERKPKCYTDVRGGVWAPDVFHHRNGDGRVYLYYTADDPDARPHGKLVGVAVAEHPLGPFEDRGVLVRGAIDAHLFEDTDGSLYLYYVMLPGGFRILGQPMADPLTLAGEPRELIRPTEAWEQHGHVTEGPWMLKHRGTYYLMYSGSGAMGPDYAIGYATADSPLGPFTKHPGNPIAHRGNGIYGPGHHCVTRAPDGSLWMVYHQKNTDKQDWDRFLALDPLWFDENGVIHTRITRGTREPGPR
jgi:beta-xylosidase